MREVLLLYFLVWGSHGCLLENGMSSVYLSAFENLKTGSVIGKLPIQDDEEDSKAKSELELAVIKGADLVEIAPGTKDLVLKKTLDRDEGVGKFEAIVECRSSNADADFSQLNISVFVTVKDVNDNPPVFDSPEYSVSIKEELPIGTIVFTDFEATDNDQPGPNSFVQYSIVKGTFSHLLDIPDPFKPVIVVKDRIDFEQIKTFSVEIEARDQGEPSLSSRVPLHVTVVDVNDLSPQFAHQYYTAKSIKDGLLVLKPEAISARDGDRLNAPLIFSLSGELSEHFEIDDEGNIKTKTASAPPRATFFVTASERDEPERSATAIVAVRLQPNIYFHHNTYSAQIRPMTKIGSKLLKVNAYSENNSSIAYSLLGDTNAVSIDEFSGNVILKKRISQPETLNVTANDGENIVMTSLTLVPIENEEACQKPPQFDKFEYKMKLGSLNVLGSVNASTRENGRIEYTLINMNSVFAIDSNGVVKFIPGNEPQCKICELVVVARDGHQLAVAKVIVENPAFIIPPTAALTILIFVILILIFSLLFIIVCKRFQKMWRNGRRASICWMSHTGDTGVSITGTTPTTTTSRYIVNSDKERCYDAKSPGPKRSQGAHLVPVTVTSRDGATPTVYF
ncbi:unnamed protein product [Caenorhabditis auriculariae]|uniref:Cadherin domain-containing protein n=1 Tax=Caenorhabditis auriculariae TaxID=2777116 RepID=A0A8S1GNQ1_9PELO|nr:unnamed protein product [Caenorhabditis auriculariae]